MVNGFVDMNYNGCILSAAERGTHYVKMNFVPGTKKQYLLLEPVIRILVF
jgi:hypothetical protein